MKSNSKLKIGLLALGIPFLTFLAYSITPRVSHEPGSCGIELTKAAMLPAKLKEELKGFVKDTASRMQVVMAIHNGRIIFEEGDTRRLINCHSARKSIMSLLIGIAQEKGLLRLDETLEQVGIDESKTPLTAQEKSATIRDLLMSRSGIYLPSEAEHEWVKDLRPKRDQHKPGEYFFYNNFDFNALGAILELKTGKSIGEFMEENLAKPLGMQDFSAANVVYGSPWPVPNKTNSDFPVYWIFMSARDLAKIGVLVTQNGKWQNTQVVSSDWLDESLKVYSYFSDDDPIIYTPFEAMSYSWWIDEDNKTVWADGYGGQFLCIDKAKNLVVVQRNFTGNSLLTSGLFLIDENRDNNPKSDLIHVYDRIKSYIEQRKTYSSDAAQSL